MNSSSSPDDFTAVLQSMFAAAPHGGAALHEVIGTRGNLKASRLAGFAGLLAEAVSQLPGADMSRLTSEEFSDLFESVLLRVAQTKSPQKHTRFRDILARYIQDVELDVSHAEMYLDLICTLSEVEITVLYQHRLFDDQYDRDLDQLAQLRAAVPDAEPHGLVAEPDDEVELERKIAGIDRRRNASFYMLSHPKFMYCKQALLSRGLLLDSGTGRPDVAPYELMSITDFGKGFIAFISRQ